MTTLSSETPGWIGVDWGSSQLRAWALNAQGEVLAHAGSERGMLSLTPDAYEAELLRVIHDWLPEAGTLEVLVCGMAGARQGWREAAYLPVPTRLDDLARGAVAPTLDDPQLEVRLLPRLCQTADLLDDTLPPGEARGTRLAARLSGLTIGLELARLIDAPGDEPTGPVTLIGNAALCDRYALALDTLGQASRRLDGEAAVLAGLGLVHRAFGA